MLTTYYLWLGGCCLLVILVTAVRAFFRGARQIPPTVVEERRAAFSDRPVHRMPSLKEKAAKGFQKRDGVIGIDQVTRRQRAQAFGFARDDDPAA
jgi:hypothetical protein